MFLSFVKIVLIPVTTGFTIRYLLGDKVQRFLDIFPAISVTIIVLIIATVVVLSHEKLPEVIGFLGILVIIHNLLGMITGYGFATLLGLPESARRTVAIEIGMQNSGLGVTLATTHFSNALVALPSSLFSIVHSVTGSSIATF